MHKAQQKRFDSLYRKHLCALKRQGKAGSTVALYAQAMQRLSEYFDCPPDVLSQEQMEHGYPKTTVLYTQLSSYSDKDTVKRINGLLAKLRVLWGE